MGGTVLIISPFLLQKDVVMFVNHLEYLRNRLTCKQVIFMLLLVLPHKMPQWNESFIDTW